LQKGGALLSSGGERKAEGVRKKRKYKTTPFSVNLMRSQMLYWAAQAQGGSLAEDLVESSVTALCNICGIGLPVVCRRDI